jgi:hypothetical protein
MPPAPSLVRSRALLVAGTSPAAASLRLMRAQTPLRRTLPAVRQLSASSSRRAEPSEAEKGQPGDAPDVAKAGSAETKPSASPAEGSSAAGSSSPSGSQAPSKGDSPQRRADLRAAALRASLQARLDELRPRVMNSLQTLLGRWNEVSGYEEVEKLKRGVEEAGESDCSRAAGARVA